MYYVPNAMILRVAARPVTFIMFFRLHAKYTPKFFFLRIRLNEAQDACEVCRQRSAIERERER